MFEFNFKQSQKLTNILVFAVAIIILTLTFILSNFPLKTLFLKRQLSIVYVWSKTKLYYVYLALNKPNVLIITVIDIIRKITYF